MPQSQPPTRLLYGPGPTQVEPRVYEAMTLPLVGHLDPYFFEVTAEIKAGLQRVFGSANEMTLAISGTGSAGMETAVCNFVEPGSKFGIFSAGYFGDRIAEMGRRHGATVIQWQKPWGSTFGEAEAAELIARDRPDTVAFIHAETSTGALQPAKAICEAAHAIGALVIADTVTSLGANEVAVDANGIDVAYSCTQKGLSCPPGLAPITVSQKAVERLDSRQDPVDVWYLDLKLLREYYDQPHKYHHTAPISMFYALREALRAIDAEGVENRWKRHREAHDHFVEGIHRLGLEMFVPERHRIPNLNTVKVPDGVDESRIRSTLLAQDGIEIAGGFGPLAGKIFRIGLMGPLATIEGVDNFLGAFARALGG
jgi:alanine-glyoxylate transaminase / serine-glyoxylate transaminase / serine-pyruvate transaminase